MEATMDNRSTLARLINGMSDIDVRQMLAYATGYEAGKISQPIQHSEEQSRNPTNQRCSMKENTILEQLKREDLSVQEKTASGEQCHLVRGVSR